ncbi:MAG: hypothetical protein U0Z44_07700 [Kouleothrix sp.]
MLSKALVVGAYQKKAEELAALPGVELTVAVPPVWREPGALAQPIERRFTRGYRLVELPIWLNGRHHLHFYPGISRLVAAVRPDVLHIDEESFNFATYQAMRAGVRYGARCCFYNWANIERRLTAAGRSAGSSGINFRHAAHCCRCVRGRRDHRATATAGRSASCRRLALIPEKLFSPAADQKQPRNRGPGGHEQPAGLGFLVHPLWWATSAGWCRRRACSTW